MTTPIGFKVPFHNNSCVRALEWNDDCFYEAVHFHEECQLTYIIEGEGDLVVGSSTYKFNSGDAYLFGKNLPHVFKNTSLKSKSSRARTISVFFNLDSFRSILNLEDNDEVIRLERLLDKASVGLRLPLDQSFNLNDRMETLFKMNDFDKVLELLNILNDVSLSTKIKFLNSESISDQVFDIRDIHRIKEVFNFVKNNCHTKITLVDMAHKFKMTPSAFCRFFKLRTQQTFSSFLLEVRIEKACKLLREGAHNATESCYDSGFTNISNYHRHFKKIKGMTPTQYVLDYAC
ncbi:AraC family transcriptional regulator [Cellulophaga sp. F20128]|uniref:AraC family transcriptional regulator n=1 Tax=Cellulophaga sp. F20128 TaxID=2926413 RepID=UPI001FF47B9C|nr:AraC family transcriptional regulator [Cellulophaga sp. F20128]MCK0156495.1 AraC family transcriptional regulator [Cellulophaga sp. F20128]